MLGRIIRGLGFRELLKLGLTCISRSSLILPTYRATKETLEVCRSKFGKKHHGDNKANAYRHAFWNYLLCEKCTAVTNSEETALAWAKRITDLHEKLSPNPEIARNMDLHNNLIGRNLFSGLQDSEENIQQILEQMLTEAIKVKEIQEIKRAGNKLVYIED